MGKVNYTKQNIDRIIDASKILFFDMDDTLVDTNFANYLSYKQAIQTINPTYTDIPYNPAERFNRTILKSVLKNLTDLEYEQIIQQKEGNYKEHLLHTKLNYSLVDLLIKYFNTNKTVLISNSREERAIMTLNYHGLTDKFSNMFFRQVSSKNIKINKFQFAIQSLGILPELIIAFENEENEITDAMEAGIQHINPKIS